MSFAGETRKTRLTTLHLHYPSSRSTQQGPAGLASSKELPPSRSPAGSCVGSNHLVHTYSFTSAFHSYIGNSSYSRFWQQDASFIFSTLLLNILQFPSSSRLSEALTPSDLLYLPAPPPSIRLPNLSPPPQFSVELDYLADTTHQTHVLIYMQALLQMG